MLSTLVGRWVWFDATVRRIARDRYMIAVAGLVAYAVACNGFGLVPTQHYEKLSRNPFVTDLTADGYFQRDILLPLVAHALGATSRAGFASLCLAVWLSALVALAWALRRMASETALLLVAVVVAHPVTTILLSWLGTPDVLSFAASAIVLCTTSPLLVAVTGCFAMTNHPVAMFALPMLLVLRSVGGERVGAAHLWALAAGLSIGALVVWAFLHRYHIVTPGRIEYVLHAGLYGWIRQNVSNLPNTVWSLHGGTWFLVVMCLSLLWRAHPRYAKAFLAVTLVSYVIAFFTEDTTRVFSLLAWAPAVHGVITTSRLVQAREPAEGQVVFDSLLLALCVVALVSPRLYAWGGDAFGSSSEPAMLLVWRLFRR